MEDHERPGVPRPDEEGTEGGAAEEPPAAAPEPEEETERLPDDPSEQTGGCALVGDLPDRGAQGRGPRLSASRDPATAIQPMIAATGTQNPTSPSAAKAPSALK